MRASVLTLGPLVARFGLRARLAARRLRHWRAARWTCTFRRSKRWARRSRSTRLRGGASANAAARRALSLRENHRDRHGKYSDGGGAGRGRNHSGELRARAGSDRPCRTADQNGRADRRRGNVHDCACRASSELHGATHTVIPDRIEAGTFLVAGAITGGELLLTDCEPEHLTAVIAKLHECGVEIRCEGDGDRCACSAREETRGRRT